MLFVLFICVRLCKDKTKAMHNVPEKLQPRTVSKAEFIVDELEIEFGLSEQNEILLAVREMLNHRRSIKISEMSEQIKSLEEHIKQIA